MATVFTIHWRNQRLILAAALVLLLGTAFVHGLWTDRWGSGRELERALARMDRIPLMTSGWTGRDLALDEEQAEGASRVGIARVARRQFVRTADGQSLSVLLMAGRFGPLSVHTPDVCYAGSGYTMLGRPFRVKVACEDGSIAAFWTARFHKPNDPGTPPLRIFWSWNASGGWQAADNPRVAYRMKPVLFKLYLVREMASLDEPLNHDPALPFLKSWLPTLDEHLYPSKTE